MPRLSKLRPAFVRLIAVATLAAFLVASVGFPVWSADAGKDLSSPFPCMYRQCGCRNAEQCWRGCCCFTNREKLAWAKEHGVNVPDYVVAAAKREAPAKSGSCCSAKKANSCCSTKSSCDAKSNRGEAGKRAKTRAGSLTVVSIIEALTCQGHVEQWVALGAMDVAQPEAWQIDLPLVETITITSESQDSLAAAPLVPPPCC
jgi:hypothetical protein